MPIARSRDLGRLGRTVGDAFTDATLPTWADAPAPASGRPTSATSTAQYVMYYAVTDTTVTPRRRHGDRHGHRADPGRPVDRRATRRWSPRGRPAAAASCGPSTRRCVTDADGSQYLYYGSLLRRHLRHPDSTDDGLHRRRRRRRRSRSTTSSRARTSSGATAGTTCSPRRPTAAPGRPPATRCQVGPLAVDRRGPFVDARRAALLNASRPAARTVVTQNGNRWIGAGHNAIATDARGPRLHRLPRDRPRRPVARPSRSASTSARC